MKSNYVTYTRRRDNLNTHGSISHVGGFGWELPVDLVIRAIASGSARFVTRNLWGHQAEVRPWPHPMVGPYVRTIANGRPTDNLLALPVQ